MDKNNKDNLIRRTAIMLTASMVTAGGICIGVSKLANKNNQTTNTGKNNTTPKCVDSDVNKDLIAKNFNIVKDAFNAISGTENAIVENDSFSNVVEVMSNGVYGYMDNNSVKLADENGNIVYAYLNAEGGISEEINADEFASTSMAQRILNEYSHLLEIGHIKDIEIIDSYNISIVYRPDIVGPVQYDMVADITFDYAGRTIKIGTRYGNEKEAKYFKTIKAVSETEAERTMDKVQNKLATMQDDIEVVEIDTGRLLGSTGFDHA